MRKVKKNWVVLSVASFSLIGAAAVMQSNQNVAFASETQVSSNSTTNQNNNNSTIDNQKNEAKAQLDAEASKIKDAINNDASLSQSDKDSQNAEVDSYKVAGEQSINSATDDNSINQALTDGKNNIDASHVAAQNSTDSNASSNASSSADQSNQSLSNSQSQQSSASSSSASLASSASSSSDAKEGLSLRDGSGAPADSDTFISGPAGGANSPQYQDAIANTNLNYKGVKYDPNTNKYVINFNFGTKVITRTEGWNRVLEFTLNTSPNLASKVSSVTVNSDDYGLQTLTNNNGEYYVKYKTEKVVGGDVTISVYVDPVKVTPSDWISATMSTHRENSKGELIKSSTKVAFTSRRSLTYDKFGDNFNKQLLGQLKGRALNDLNQTSPLNQATQLLNNYTSQINAVTTDGDFVSQLNAIQNAYRADNTSIANAMTQLQNQKASSTTNVSNLSNLSASDKQSANNSISTAFQTAQANLLGVSQSSQIADSLSDGINNIKHEELTATISSAINNLNYVYGNNNSKIKSDKTNTSEQIKQQLQNLDSDMGNYTSQIKAVTDPANVEEIRKKAVIQLNGDYVPGPSISNQKITAKDALDAEATKIEAAIRDDKTLTTEKRNQEISKVRRAKDIAGLELSNYFNADAINNALKQGIKNIDDQHVSGDSLEVQKAAAIKSLEDKATQTKQVIANDNTLTSDEKKSQSSKIDNDVEDGKNAINNETDADSINNALNDENGKIVKEYKPGISLDEQRTKAKAILEDEAASVKNKIDNDYTLTSSDKKSQNAYVSRFKEIGQSNIDSSTNADDINTARKHGIQDIDNQYQPGTPLSDQKKYDKDQLDDQAYKIKQDIANDATLTQDQKNAQIAKVNADTSAGKQAIDNANDVDSINDAFSKSSRQIVNDHQSGNSVDNQQSNANANLEAEATKVKNQIDADNRLTSAQKDTQKANVDRTKAVAQAAVNAATNADDINTAYNKGITDIDKQYVPGKTSLADQKTNAKANLDAQADKIKNDIENDATLTQDKKNAQLAQLQTDKTAAEQAIENAQNADAINQAISGGNTKMAHDHQSGDSIDSQKASAKQAIQDEANKVKAAIDADTSLTGAEKDQQKNEVNSVAKAEQAKIDGLTNVDDIHNQITQSVKDIDDVHQSGKSLDDQKAAAKSQLDAQAAKIKQDIANDETLTQADKDAQSAKVDADVKSGNDAIDNASDADSINGLIKDNKDKIAADHVSHASVDDQKASNKKTLEDQAAKVKQDIANDSTLTQAEKDAQTAKVDSDKEAAEKAIDAASDAEGVKKATDAGNKQINADHVPGKSVDDQKAAAKKTLDDQAAKIKQDIENDATLTQAEKDAQSAKVDADRDAGEKAIDGAKDADDINKLISDTTGKINGDHVSGQSVADQKTSKKNDLDNEANKIKGQIDADNTLTQAEKDAQKAAIDADVDAGKKAIDAAKDAEGIKQAVDSSNQKIDGDHKSDKSVADQKNDAKSQMDAEANKIKAAIDADDTLTGAEKAQQKKNVDDANKAAQAKIDDASNADEINNAIKDGNTNIDDQHKQGTSVKDQQAAAKKQLDDEADKIKQDIDNDPTLSKSAKDAQKAKIDNDVQAGKDAIDKQSNADDINQAITDAKKAIDGEHVSGTPLSDQKKTAQDQLNTQAAKIKQDIQNDATLTSDQKKDQIAKVNQDVEGGKNAINSATDADGINDALSGANNKVGNDHKPAASVSDQKSNASSQLDAEAKKIKQDIQNDATLTSDQKKDQIAKVNQDVEGGKNAINNATDADSINKALSDANKAIDGEYVPGTPLDKQKYDAKNAIDAEAAKIKSDIDADNTLNNDEKKAQKDKVDSDAQAGKDAIDKATDADSINKVISDTNAQVDKDYVTSTVSLQDQKSNAKKQLEELAAKTKQDIANDATLTQSEKDAQTAQVESDKTAAEKAIDNASDAEDIKEATDNGNKQINADHNSGDSVDTQKQSANGKLDAEANKIKNQIDADNTLTSDEKEQQKKNVDQANQDAKAKIKAASNADEINDLVSQNTGENGIIDKQHNSGKSVKDQQDAAKSQMDAEANKIKADIDADNTLTSDEKKQQKNNVDDANKAAKDNIDAASNADEINDLISKNTGKDGIIDKEHVPGKSVDDQKSAAKQKLEAQAVKVKNDIANDATLTKEQRDAQVAKVDTDKNAAENAVDAATDADSINKAINDGNDKISKDHVPGTSVSDQKDKANAQLDAEAKKIKSEIDNDNSLTSVEKDVQKAKVDADVKSGKEAIDNATEADNINKAVSDTNAQVDKDHVAGASVDSQKDAAKQQLDAQAAKTKQDITNDATLTQAEKDAQIAKVESDKTAGEKAIDDAKDADSINQALVNSNKQIGADHVPGNSLNDQKDAAKKQLDAEADKTKATIDADKTLTSAEKAQQKANVDAKNKAAQDNVDAQTNADNINALTAQGVEEIDAQYVPGKVSLSDQKTNAKDQLEEEAAKVKNDIANDATLTQDQKNTQMAQVDADKEAGEQAIDNATDADSINQIISDTNAKMDADHVSGQSIDDQKTAAKDAINTEANKVKAEIDADKTLSKDEKQRQKNNVDRALAVAQSVIDGLNNADDINAAIAQNIHIIDVQHVKKQNNGSGPNQVIPRNVYMIKNFYRYLSTNFTKKNRVEGYKATSRPNAVMFRIIGETTNKNGVKRYKVYQIVIKKNGLFKVDRKKWGYITARPSYMRPLYYSSNVHTIKVIGKRVRAYKNVKLKNAVNAYKQGTVLKVKAVKKFGSTYRLQLTNGTYISANKNLVKKESIPRDIYMVKGFYRYSSVNFSHKNRIEGYKKQSRPNAVMFRVAGEYTNKRGLKRYKVYQIVRNKKGLFRVDYKKWGYVTAKPSFVKPLYYSSNVQKVKVIGNRIRSYRKPNLSKAVSSYKRGTVLKVKAVKKLGTAYRLQLSNGNYISANKNLVQVIK